MHKLALRKKKMEYRLQNPYIFSTIAFETRKAQIVMGIPKTRIY